MISKFNKIYINAKFIKSYSSSKSSKYFKTDPIIEVYFYAFILNI